MSSVRPSSAMLKMADDSNRPLRIGEAQRQFTLAAAAGGAAHFQQQLAAVLERERTNGVAAMQVHGVDHLRRQIRKGVAIVLADDRHALGTSKATVDVMVVPALVQTRIVREDSGEPRRAIQFREPCGLMPRHADAAGDVFDAGG